MQRLVIGVLDKMKQEVSGTRRPEVFLDKSGRLLPIYSPTMHPSSLSATQDCTLLQLRLPDTTRWVLPSLLLESAASTATPILACARMQYMVPLSLHEATASSSMFDVMLVKGSSISRATGSQSQKPWMASSELADAAKGACA
eukprot:6189859-Pleurochrysis_carterae.AAC.1